MKELGKGVREEEEGVTGWNRRTEEEEKERVVA